MWCPIIHEWGQPNKKVTSMEVTVCVWLGAAWVEMGVSG